MLGIAGALSAAEVEVTMHRGSRNRESARSGTELAGGAPLVGQEVLEAAHCWEAEDRAATPAMTEFRRRSRYHQAMWREARGYPIGTQPYRPKPDGPPARLVGSRLPLDFAQETGATFLTADALAAARRRTETVERHQNLDRPADVGRPPLVGGAVDQPVRRPRGRPRARRPCRPRLVAGRARDRRRRPLRALARPLRPRLPQQPPAVRRRVRAGWRAAGRRGSSRST